MNFSLSNAAVACDRATAKRKTTILLLSVVFFFAFVVLVVGAPTVFAQKRFSKTYPATTNVHLQLTNRMGTVEVRGWDKDKVEINAYLEAPAANIVPEYMDGKIRINVVRDNQDREDVGNCNFLIKVPFSSKVDIETKMGNLTVSDVRGGLVRARITLEGEIRLLNILSGLVMAENGIGDIFFDGEIQQGGNYRFTATRGNINLRIPFTSSFRLVATAPSTRSISLGAFTNADLNSVGNGQRVVGRVNGGSASLTVTNHRGSISFIRR